MQFTPRKHVSHLLQLKVQCRSSYRKRLPRQLLRQLPQLLCLSFVFREGLNIGDLAVIKIGATAL